MLPLDKTTGVSEILNGLTANTEYLIQVAACNAPGSSNWSPGTIVQTASDTSGNNGGNNGGGTSTTCGDAAPGSTGTPATPPAPTLNVLSTTSVRVSWVAPSDGGSAILRYAIHYVPDGGSGSWTTSDTGLTADTSYSVRVAACNAKGYGDWSPTASTPSSNNNGNGGGECGDATRGIAGTPDRPAAPTLIVTQHNTRVGVEWVAPDDND